MDQHSEVRTANLGEKIYMNKMEVKWRLLVINSQYTVIESKCDVHAKKNQLISFIKYCSMNEIKNI